ncbi:MAG: acylglycerol kinase family protein [Candidatus Calescibacterium sp.]|nr:acylglycerol kinase family protein [Candidatus Calescibacterium sp.]MCX7734901.1 acylglycerol kinase family protein [bacterium]MDW8086592.1 diacylglycerol kinase family protein [Candidatus Calescibacterium sp.]
MKITVIINPHSGKAKHGFFEKERFVDIFRKYLSSEHKYEIFSSKSREDTEKNMEYFVQSSDVIAVTGGDGTLNHFINSAIPFLSKKRVLIFPIGGGSLNVIHKNVIPNQSIGTAPRLLCDIVNSMSNSENPEMFVKKLRAISFENSGGTKYGFMFANGVVYKAMKRYYSKGVGPEVALKTIAEMLFDVIMKRDKDLLEYTDCSIEIDGKDFPYGQKIVASVAASFKKMILFTKPFIESEGDGFYFMASADPATKVALNFLWIVLGKKVLPKTFNGKAKKVFLSFSGGYTIDGELFESRDIEMILSEGPYISFLTLPQYTTSTR